MPLKQKKKMCQCKELDAFTSENGFLESPCGHGIESPGPIIQRGSFLFFDLSEALNSQLL